MPTAGEFKNRKKQSDRIDISTAPRSGKVQKTKKKKVKFVQKLVQIFSRKRKKRKRKKEDFYDGLEIPFALEFYRRRYIQTDEHGWRHSAASNFEGNKKSIAAAKAGDHEFQDQHLRRGRRGTYVYDAAPKRKQSTSAPVEGEIPQPELSGGDKPEIGTKRKFSLKNVSEGRTGKKRKSLVTPKNKGNETKFRGKPATEVHIPWTIMLLSGRTTMVGVETLTCILIYLYYLVITYTYTFDPGNDYFEVFLLTCDYYFLVEAILRLTMEVWRRFSDVDYTVLLIPCTMNMWILTLISLCPLDYIYELGLAITQDDSIYHIFGTDLLRLNRLIYLVRVYIFFGQLKREQYLSDFWAFMLSFFAVYIGFIQFISCLYFGITGVSAVDHLLARPGGLVNEATWLSFSYFTKPGIVPSPVAHYVMAVHFVTNIVTTVGYGEPAPRNESEMLLAIVVMLLGAIIMAGLFGSKFTGFLLERDSARTVLFNRVNLLLKHLALWGSTALFANKVKEYYDCMWNYREGIHRVDIIRQLPPSMYDDVLFDICTEFFHKGFLFRDLEEAFLRAVSQIVEVAIYNPDMIVCRQGDCPSAMYYIIHGECVVKSKFSANIITAILRPGCIFGESNLFIPYPHEVSIETRTCCQFLIIRRNKLLDVLADFKGSWNIMRSRLHHRLQKVTENYQQLGEYPVVWAKLNYNIEKTLTDDNQNVFKDHPVVIRWAHGLNSRVQRDMDAFEAPVIVEIPCRDPFYANDPINTFGTCVISPILDVPSAFLQFWHLSTLCLTLFLTLALTYGASIGGASEVSIFLITLANLLDYPACAIYLCSLIIEILTACPVSGAQFRFWDGVQVKKWEFSFYVDIISVFPPIESSDLYAVVIHIGVGRALKLFTKLTRYFNYLDEKNPSAVFRLRLVKTLLLFCINAWLAACILFYLACDPPSDDATQRNCTGFNWLNSWYIRRLTEEDELISAYESETLANTNPFLLACHFTIATISSAGFGDFGPHTLIEMVWITLMQLYGFFLVGYFTAKLTSALSCIYLPKVNFEEKMVAVLEFCDLHGLSMRLRDRLHENYQLEHQYYEGVTLPENTKYLMYDAPFFFSDDALYAEIGTHLEGIPLFSHADPERLINIAKLLHRYVLPPDIVFLHRGDVRRQLYIIYSGSVALLKEDTNHVKSILEATGHFGLRDLLYAEPAFSNVKTLSYCIIYALDFQDFSLIFSDDTELMAFIENKSSEYQATVDALNKIFSLAGEGRSVKERPPTDIPSWVIFPTKEDPNAGLYSYEEFIKPFKERGGKILRWFLMRRTIHPAGAFALFWCILSSSAGILIVLINLFELMLQFLSPNFHYPLWISKIIFIIDAYLRLHWGFYTESNHLVSHPLKTATHHLLEGPYIFSVMLEMADFSFVPFILNTTNLTGNGEGFKWLYKLELHRLLHLFRMPVFLQFGHSVKNYRTFTLLLVYVLLTLVGCTFLACLAIYLPCPWDQTRWMSDFPSKIPACYAGTWIDTKATLREDAARGAPRWLMAIYYVCQTILVVGYGDMSTLNASELYLLVMMVIAGFVATRVIISDLTAAVVSGDEVRGLYLERMKAVEAVLRKQRVERNVIEKVNEHLQYTWLLSKGLQPQEFLSDLHPALRADLYREYIGDALSKVPLFYGWSDNVLKELCTHLRKFYFTPGERIMRRGSLEYEMYIIFDGDVWITGRNTTLMCTLGPGETFGESQMIFGILRKYSAIAANSVEVFALNSDGFVEMLERYPYLRDQMQERMNGVRADLFERKIEFGRERFFSHEKEQQEASDRVSDKIRKILASRDVQEDGEQDEDEERVIDTRAPVAVFLEKYIFSWGSLDAGLPFFYLASESSTGRISWLLHPRCGFQRYFANVIIWVSILSPALGMYAVVFPEKDPFRDALPLLIFSTAMEIVYVIYMILQFFTPFVTVEGKYCKEPTRIRYRYLTFVTFFTTDLISCTPVEFLPLVPAVRGSKFLEYVKYLNLLKTLRLIHYYRTLNEGLEKITLTTFRYRVVISVTTFFLLGHFLACVFFFVAQCDLTYCPERTWTHEFVKMFLDGDMSEENLKFWKWYIRSLYWVVTTVSTTGFGDIVATNLTEIALSILCIFVGAFILAIILSQFTLGITSLDKFHREYLYQLKIVVQYLGSLGLSSFRKNALLEWFLMRWDLSRGYSFRQAVDILPLSMQINVTLALYHKTILQVRLFKGMEPRFHRCLAYFLDHSIYLPGQVIASEGSRGNTLFIVARGRVSGYTLSQKGVPKLIRWYDDGCIFGRLPALFYDQSYTKTYRAEVVTEILTLSKRSIFYLCRYFYTFERRIQDFITEAYDPHLGVDTLFAVEREARYSLFLSGASGNESLLHELKLNKKTNTDSRRKKHKHRKDKKKRPKMAVSKHKQALDEQYLESKAEDLLKAFKKVEREQQGLLTSEEESQGLTEEGWEEVKDESSAGDKGGRAKGGGEGPA